MEKALRNKFEARGNLFPLPKENKVNEEEMAALQAELEGARKEVEEMKGQLGERDAKLGDVQRQLAEAAASNEASEQELASLRASLDEKDAQLAATAETLTQAVEKYRASLIAANPEMPEEMLIGESIADIDASVDKAQELVSRVRTRLEQDLKATPVPAGAPQRSGPDLSSMSPREKIQYALGKEA
jgi:septal ring factor EnvC (AmiA/AmiB activator)